MADPLKAARRMFGEFLSKADPLAVPCFDLDAKDHLAQAAGRKGAKQGGLARAASLTRTRRIQIAKRAAQARWKKPKKA
jgi:hypothetical protein